MVSVTPLWLGRWLRINGICVVRWDHKGLAIQTGFSQPSEEDEGRVSGCRWWTLGGSDGESRSWGFTLSTFHPLYSQSCFILLIACIKLKLDLFFFHWIKFYLKSGRCQFLSNPWFCHALHETGTEHFSRTTFMFWWFFLPLSFSSLPARTPHSGGLPDMECEECSCQWIFKSAFSGMFRGNLRL